MRALVTGGGKRLGRVMALALGQRGYDVAVHYAGSATGAAEVVAELAAMGRRAVALQADLTREDAMQALLPRAADALGPLDLLINNASIFEHDRFGSLTRASWDRHMESNLRAAVVLSERFAEQAPKAPRDASGEARAGALIINMIDQRVRKITPEFLSYTVAKYGLWGFTQAAARALAPDIRVNAIGPGPTLQGERQSAAGYAKQRLATVLQRGADPSDITAALAYLIDARAVTGQLICVDGGQHLAWQTPDVLDIS